MNSDLQKLLRNINENLNANNFDKAVLLINSFLVNHSNNINILFDYGITLAQANKFHESLVIFKCLNSHSKNDVKVLFNLGTAYSILGYHQNALDSFLEALAICPNDIEIIHNVSASLIDLKNYDEALFRINSLIFLNSNYAAAWLIKGIALSHLRCLKDSVISYDTAISLNPNFYQAWSNRSVPLLSLGCHNDALQSCNKALEINPNYAEGWFNKGNVLYELKCYDEALTHYDKALCLNPNYAEGWFNKGNVLYELKRYDEALTHYDKALCLNPNYAEGWFNKGNVLYELKRYDEALTHYDKALCLNPNYPEGWSIKGNVLYELKRYDEALTHYDKALCLKPSIDFLYGDFIHLKMKVCDWSNFDNQIDHIGNMLQKSNMLLNPFALLALIDDPLVHKNVSSSFFKSKFSLNFSRVMPSKGLRKDRIRLGYFSADFRNHPVSHLIAELFEIHDSYQFEVYLFSLLNSNDEMAFRLRKFSNRFIDIENLSDEDSANLACNLDIDIAIDLTGHTQGARSKIFSYRAAPIQVNYLGYPGTMGTNIYDYIIADKVVIPESSKIYYNEKVVYLPNTYQVNSSKYQISNRFFSRRDLGLQDNGFVFCCFNNNFKIIPTIFDIWMRILNAVDGSMLWLFEDSPSVSLNLKSQAMNRGVNPSRLVFAKRMDSANHLERHRFADLFLDTFPYNAHTTASDSLRLGVPVLTLIGQSFASRVAASLLHTIGLPELITSSQEEYEKLAIELAKNPEKLASIKNKLLANRLSSPLFNTALFAKNIESAYLKMYERYHDGLDPDHIQIS